MRRAVGSTVSAAAVKVWARLEMGEAWVVLKAPEVGPRDKCRKTYTCSACSLKQDCCRTSCSRLRRPDQMRSRSCTLLEVAAALATVKAVVAMVAMLVAVAAVMAMLMAVAAMAATAAAVEARAATDSLAAMEDAMACWE